MGLRAAAVRREVVRLAWPAILSSLLQTAVFLADRLMLGRYGQEALASMQVQGPVMWSVFSVFMGTLVGTVALVARSVGAGDRPRAVSVARASLRMAAGIGVAVGLVGAAGADLVALALGPEDAALRGLSVEYLRLGFLGLPGLFLSTTAAMVLQGAGDTRTPLLAGAAANVANVALNAALIFGVELGPVTVPAFGVAGAAAASTIAFTLEAWLLLRVLKRPAAVLHVPQPFMLGATEREARAGVLALALPAVLDRVAVHVGFLGFVRVITWLGPVAMAANQALVTVESICFLSADGFAVAGATIVGQRLGAGDPSGARQGGWAATYLAVGALTCCGAIIYLAGEAPLWWFVPAGSDGRDMVTTGVATLWVLAVAQPFMAAGVVLAQSLRGAGDTRSPFWSALFGCLIVRLGLAWWLGIELGLGLVGVWLASTADWVLRTVILTVVFERGAWRTLRV
jgi:putative MATE family efflux protein